MTDIDTAEDKKSEFADAASDDDENEDIFTSHRKLDSISSKHSSCDDLHTSSSVFASPSGRVVLRPPSVSIPSVTANVDTNAVQKGSDGKLDPFNILSGIDTAMFAPKVCDVINAHIINGCFIQLIHIVVLFS